MPYFKDTYGYLHFLSETDMANGGAALIPDGCIEITDDEAFAISQTPSESDIIKSQIAELESQITQRRMREAVLGTDGGWLAQQDDAIAQLRSKL